MYCFVFFFHFLKPTAPTTTVHHHHHLQSLIDLARHSLSSAATSPFAHLPRDPFNPFAGCSCRHQSYNISTRHNTWAFSFNKTLYSVNEVKASNCEIWRCIILSDFGIQVREELTLVEARVLPPRRLMYHKTGKESSVDPWMGQWNMINKKIIDGGKVRYWARVNFSTRVARDLPSNFCFELISMCTSKGMDFARAFGTYHFSSTRSNPESSWGCA
ncbi:hypothetical protein RIF29_36317 [Crotalaria pallida]|uniref:Protein argonaute Mid domain-containing protein n=1 Tax=Crotalaria pallida TaxID=3830 RepID=A0AAN9EBB3_CROPI